jgi:hypothetical protein
MRTSFIEDLQSDFAVAEQYVSTAGETAWEELAIGMTLPPVLRSPLFALDLNEVCLRHLVFQSPIGVEVR